MTEPARLPIASARQAFVAAESSLDASVNWVRPTDIGQLEARYVRRTDDYCVVYLSSQTGCVQACRMCHLTATGQTKHRNATLEEFLEQATVVLEHYDKSPKARTVHYNFMARGEALANPVITENSEELFDELWKMARARDLHARFLVSTILPKTSAHLDIRDVFSRYQPEIYYSLYSTDEAFRRRWLPKAQPVEDALDRLVAWQRHSYKIVKIHYAFIEGQNDSADDVNAVCDAIEARGLSVHVNIVRYNPPSPRHGSEPADEVLERNAGIFRARLPNARVRVIGRVGFDVHASCGMFVGK